MSDHVYLFIQVWLIAGCQSSMAAKLSCCIRDGFNDRWPEGRVAITSEWQS